MKNIIKKVSCVVLSVCMMSSAAVFAADNANSVTKDETVYVMLNSDGTVRNEIVSSWIHSDNGMSSVSEKLDLSDVKNVTADTKPTNNEGKISWDTKDNDVYYQGTTTKVAPIAMNITYKLDGKEISAHDIAGKSGKIEISIKYKNNLKSSATINNKARDIYTPLAAVTVCDFKTDVFKNVKCENAKVTSDGNNQVVTILSIPGLKESLGSSYSFLSDVAEVKLYDEFKITADATNFELAPMITGVTTDIDLKTFKASLDKNKFISSVKAMKEATDKVVDGTSKLSGALKEYADKMSQLEKSYQTFNAGVGKLSSGANELNNGAKQVSDGVLEYTKKINGIFSEILGKMGTVEQQLAGVKQTVTADVTKLGGDVQSTSKEMEGIMTDLGKLIAQIDGLEASNAVDKTVTNNLKATATSMYAQLQGHIKTLGAIGEDVKKIAGTTQKLSGDLNEQYKQIKQKLAPMQKELTEKSAMLSGGAQKVAKGVSDLKLGADELGKGSTQVNEGIKQLNSASKTLAEKSGELNGGVNKFKTEAIGKIDNSIGVKIDDAQTLLQLNNVLVEKVENYNSFTGKPENCTSTVKFVMKTDEIKKQVESVDTTQKPVAEKKGFWQSIGDFFSSLFSK